MNYEDEWFWCRESATCDSVGISGNCGIDCPVFNRGDCKYRADDVYIIDIWNNGNREVFEKYDEFEYIYNSFEDYNNPTEQELVMFELTYGIKLE